MKKNKLLFYATLVAFVAFVILKLTGVIAWSWWLITAPLWAPLLFAVILVIIFLVLVRKSNRV